MTGTQWDSPRGNIQRLFNLANLTFVLLAMGFALQTTHLLILADPATPPPSTTVLCPLNLTQQLQCMCHVLTEKRAVQILCNNTQPDKVWGALKGYSVAIEKMSIRSCPEKTNSLEQLQPLKIRSLEISKCSIARIHPNAFDAMMEHLHELLLHGNALSTVPKLNKLKRLQSLDLNHNMIKELADSSFSGLNELKLLRLKRNNICNLTPNIFGDQRSSLELLDLGYNCFTAVPAHSLRNCGELKWLSLAGNNIDEILPMHFMSLPKLMELRLHSNKLKRIATNGFMNVPSLRHLFLEDNQLGSLEPGTLQTFKELQLIDLGSNVFYKIPSFKEMPELEEVRLHNNRIRTIDTLTFSANPKLRRILLQNNQIDTIARNSFDALDHLEVLVLSNNALTVIEKGMLDGMKGLKDLMLRNNSIAELNRDSFTSVPELLILDLSDNELKTIRAGTFVPLHRLSSLSLANNEIATVEKGAFARKVDIVLLDGNPLRCDDQLDWFVTWLVQNKVRTFMPNQPEIKCALPASSNGTRLKDMMIAKNNITEALSSSFQAMNLGRVTNPNEAGNLLKLIPNFARQVEGARMGSEMLSSLTQSFPEIRNFPGMKFLPTTLPGTQISSGSGKTLDAAIDQFSEPLVKFATGATPSGSDVSRLLSSIPDLVVNIPGFGNVDVSKLNPSLIEHVLKGGQIPGIPKETLDHIVKQYMQRLYIAAAQAQGITTTEFPPLPPGTDPSKLLRPVSELPQGMVQSVVSDKPLPHLTSQQTNVIKEYYMQKLPSGDINIGNETEHFLNITGLLPPKVFQMMKILPPNYNLSKLPPDLIKQVMRGEMPDLTLLPMDLQQWIKDNFDRLVASLENSPDLSLEDIMKKLPTFEHPKMSTFSPYDINTVDADLVVKRRSEENARFWRIFAACALGLAGAVTLGVLSAFFWYVRRSRIHTGDVLQHGPGTPRTPGTLSSGRAPSFHRASEILPSVVMREQSFRPSATSTLKSSNDM